MKFTIQKLDKKVSKGKETFETYPEMIQAVYTWMFGSDRKIKETQKSVNIFESRLFIVHIKSGLIYDTDSDVFNKNTWEHLYTDFSREDLQKIINSDKDRFKDCAINTRLIDCTSNYSF